MQRDDQGRRVFKTEARALKAQRIAMAYHGVCSGVVRRSDGLFVLLYDPQAE